MFTISTVFPRSLSEKLVPRTYQLRPWILNVSTDINGQDSRKNVASKVRIYLISPLDFTILAGLVLSDRICLENSKNVAYLGDRCDQGKLLLSAQMGGRCNQGGGDVTRGRSDGRPVWLEMPHQKHHRYISKPQRKIQNSCKSYLLSPDIIIEW